MPLAGTIILPICCKTLFSKTLSYLWVLKEILFLFINSVCAGQKGASGQHTASFESCHEKASLSWILYLEVVVSCQSVLTAFGAPGWPLEGEESWPLQRLLCWLFGERKGLKVRDEKLQSGRTGRRVAWKAVSSLLCCTFRHSLSPPLEWL